ncbi:hypothetical protein AXG93_868s1200 [Marchantia polymorpha subsp. ruderalis]|uniref:Uncharacterized protein n=1 Tax=Marchantia polymorpha subsp. ruderalis TaxID=1480154 RepID=A0A176VLS7_MARPO|nr:hypothetical protein AXG93_868s1200 [Marchantia polymorpha subsp. ruderalis]
MEGPLEEEEEQQYDTEIETASESLRPLEQSPAPSAEDLGSSGTVDLDCGEGPSTKETKTAKLSAADILSERVVPLLRYLDRKRTKYVEPELVGYYVELVRSNTMAKVAASVKMAKRVASLISNYATVKATLQERDEQLWQKELECAKL